MRQTTTALLVLVVALAAGSARGSTDSDSAEAVVATLASAAILGVVCGVTVQNFEEPSGDDHEYDRRGWRIGVSGRYAIETFTDDLESDLRGVLGSGKVSSEESFGISGRVGYRCHERFSVETEVEWLEGFDSDVSLPGIGKIATFEVEPVVVTSNIKGHLLTGRYQPFLLVGAGLMTGPGAELKDSLGLEPRVRVTGPDFAMRFGGGIDLYATKHIVVSAESSYVLPFEGLEDFDYVSIGLGLEYRF